MKKYAPHILVALCLMSFLALVVFVISVNVEAFNVETAKSDGSIQRYYDAQADVVCWYFVDAPFNREGLTGGIACLPRMETTLPETP